MDYQGLIAAAARAREKAYAPYSRYRVGAAVLTEEGQIFTGCNVENIAYGSTICAERTAIVKAISEGYRRFKALAIVVDSDTLGIPCGACRQVIAEHAPNITIISANLAGDYKIYDFAEIFPVPFTRQHLD